MFSSAVKQSLRLPCLHELTIGSSSFRYGRNYGALRSMATKKKQRRRRRPTSSKSVKQLADSVGGKAKRPNHRSPAATRNTIGNARNSKHASRGTGSISKASSTSSSSNLESVLRWIQPIQYYHPKRIVYKSQHGYFILQRLPLFVGMAFVALLHDRTSMPFGIMRIHGPSMIPTMGADGSDIWLVCKSIPLLQWWRRIKALVFGSSSADDDVNFMQYGDIVGFAHPEYPSTVSCKRIVGLPGDTVQRYGEYVHLYSTDDNDGYGMIWPNLENTTATTNTAAAGVDGDDTDVDNEHQRRQRHHSWIDRSCPWDDAASSVDDSNGQFRRIKIPKHHVWIEADCPALGVDSRHFGPVPMSWLQGIVISKIWPSIEWATAISTDDHRNSTVNHNESTANATKISRARPHPIPLDDATLAEYNVHHCA